MNQLRLYFNSTDLVNFTWYRLHEQTLVDSGVGTTEQLKSLLKTGDDVLFVVPAHWVYVTQVEAKNRQQKQLLSAIAYQLEDQLAEDIDALHFAQGEENDGMVSFTVISHQLMQQLIAFEQESSVKASAIISEYDVIKPQISDEISLWESQSHCIISQGDCFQAISCDLAHSDFYLQHVFKQTAVTAPRRIASKDWQGAHIDLKAVNNLKQKDYSQGHVLQHVLQQFKVPGVLLVLLLLGLAFSVVMKNHDLQQQLNSLKKQQMQLLQTKLSAQQIGSNPKKALIKALQSQATQQQTQGFIAIFYQFIKLKQSIPSVNLKKLDYRNKQLVVDLQAKSLQDLDQLAEQLKTQFKVKVDQMNSTAIISQGRFILELKP